MTDVAIIGTGRTPFGRFPDQSAIEMGAQAVRASLTDAGKVVLMMLMLLGRLGPLTAAVALGRQRTPYQPEYLEEEPLVG